MSWVKVWPQYEIWIYQTIWKVRRGNKHENSRTSQNPHDLDDLYKSCNSFASWNFWIKTFLQGFRTPTSPGSAESLHSVSWLIEWMEFYAVSAIFQTYIGTIHSQLSINWNSHYLKLFGKTFLFDLLQIPLVLFIKVGMAVVNRLTDYSIGKCLIR